jgi:KDO2-lipid IV(A) lauroyltransferase
LVFAEVVDKFATHFGECMAEFKKIRRAVRQPFETAGVKLLQLTIPLLPRSAIVGLSRLAARIVWMLPIREKKIGLKNIDAVFGDTKTPQEKRFILTTSFATFCQTMIDVFWFSKNPEKRIPRYVEFDSNFESFHQNKAYICITAHFGNWEVMGQAASLQGTDLASIAATVKNQAVDRILIEQREKTGQTIIPQKGALRTLIARFRKNGKAAFVLDQNTSLNEGGIMVDFLGLPMPVSSAPASLAYRTQTEIFFGFCMPKAGGKYMIYSLGSIQPPAFDKEKDASVIVQNMTQQIQDRISGEIRAHPEFWLWSYKHWRRTRGESYPENYPDY